MFIEKSRSLNVCYTVLIITLFSLSFIVFIFKSDFVAGLLNEGRIKKKVEGMEQPCIVETEKIKSLQKLSVPQFETAVEFFKYRDLVLQPWRERRGYLLAEVFNGYDGPNTYIGPHAYGYFEEEVLKGLAEQGDVEAQIIYAEQYLMWDDSDLAYDYLQEAVINSEQTKPLISMAQILLGKNLRLNIKNQPDNKVDKNELMRNENKAYAHYLIMMTRFDPHADQLLVSVGYDEFSRERKNEIQKISNVLFEQMRNARLDRGLAAYQDEPINIAAKMGLSSREYQILKARFDKVLISENDAQVWGIFGARLNSSVVDAGN